MLYQAKARVRAAAGTASGQQRLLQGRERPGVLAVRAQRAQHGRHHDQRRVPAPAPAPRPAAVIRNAEPSSTRRRPSAAASEATRIVKHRVLDQRGGEDARRWRAAESPRRSR